MTSTTDAAGLIPAMNYRYQQFGQIPDHRGFEYADGTWVERVSSFRSSYIAGKLAIALHVFGEETKTGFGFSAGLGYQCFPDEPLRVRKCDASFIAAGRMTPETWETEFCPIPPDFAAEVISPNEDARLVSQKVHEYVSVGVRLVWLIYPATEAAWILRANGTGQWVTGAAILDGEDVIPGFKVALDSLFPKA